MDVTSYIITFDYLQVSILLMLIEFGIYINYCAKINNKESSLLVKMLLNKTRYVLFNPMVNSDRKLQHHKNLHYIILVVNSQCQVSKLTDQLNSEAEFVSE